MTKKYKSDQEWQQLIDQQHKSGLTIARFCKEHQISESCFYRKKREVQQKQHENVLIPVVADILNDDEKISFSLNGLKLEFDSDCADEQLKRIIKVCASL